MERKPIRKIPGAAEKGKKCRGRKEGKKKSRKKVKDAA